MKSALLSNIFDGQFKSVFIAKNRFVLRSVIHKHTVNIFHMRNSEHIKNKYDYSDYALKKRMKFKQLSEGYFIDNK